MHMLFWRKIFEDGKCPISGFSAAPDLEYPELLLISYAKPIKEKYLACEPRSGTKSQGPHLRGEPRVEPGVWRPEMWAQLYSQEKLTTLRCEMWKIRHKNEKNIHNQISRD
jgi:hypothetical protein